MITSAGLGDSEVTPNAKSVIWAGIVIFALGATIWYLLPHGQPAHSQPVHVVPQPSPDTDRAIRGLRGRHPRPKRPVVILGSEKRRITFVSQLQERFAKKGKEVSVDAVGPEKRTLRLMWAPRPDREHMEQLKGAEPFAREARGEGFSSIVMQVGQRIVWQKSL